MPVKAWSVFGEIAVQGLDKSKGGLVAFNEAGRKTASGLLGITSKASTAALGIAALGAAAIIIGVKSTRAFAQFDQAMTRSLAIMHGVTEALRSDLVDAAKKAGRESLISATDAAEGYFFLTSAGLDAVATIKAMPVVMRFAQAGMFNMARATDLLTDAQSALGLTIRTDAVENVQNMTRVSDVFARANELANATISQFSEAITTKFGPRLRVLRKDVEEGAAVLAVMADQGIKATLAGERANIMFRDLAARASENSDAFRKLGIQVFDTTGNMRHIADVIQDFERVMGSASSTQQAATFKLLGLNLRAQDTVTQMIGMSDAIRGFDKQLRETAQGTTIRIARKQLDTLSSQWNIFKGNIESIALGPGGSVGNTLKSIFEGINTTMQALLDTTKLTVKEFNKLYEAANRDLHPGSTPATRNRPEMRKLLADRRALAAVSPADLQALFDDEIRKLEELAADTRIEDTKALAFLRERIEALRTLIDDPFLISIDAEISDLFGTGVSKQDIRNLLVGARTSAPLDAMDLRGEMAEVARRFEQLLPLVQEFEKRALANLITGPPAFGVRDLRGLSVPLRPPTDLDEILEEERLANEREAIREATVRTNIALGLEERTTLLGILRTQFRDFSGAEHDRLSMLEEITRLEIGLRHEAAEKIKQLRRQQVEFDVRAGRSGLDERRKLVLTEIQDQHNLTQSRIANARRGHAEGLELLRTRQRDEKNVAFFADQFSRSARTAARERIDREYNTKRLDATQELAALEEAIWADHNLAMVGLQNTLLDENTAGIQKIIDDINRHTEVDHQAGIARLNARREILRQTGELEQAHIDQINAANQELAQAYGRQQADILQQQRENNLAFGRISLRDHQAYLQQRLLVARGTAEGEEDAQRNLFDNTLAMLSEQEGHATRIAALSVEAAVAAMEAWRETHINLFQLFPDLELQYTKALEGIINEGVTDAQQLQKRFEQLGAQFVAGLVTGTLDGKSLFRSAIFAVAQAGISALIGGLGIFSPSRVTRAIGFDVSAGLALGITDGGSLIRDALGEVIRPITELNLAQPGGVGGGIGRSLPAPGAVLTTALGGGSSPAARDRVQFDFREFPPARDPRQAARDTEWIDFLQESLTESDQLGFKRRLF